MNILNENNRLVDTKYIEELITDLQLKVSTNKTLDSIKKVLNSSFSESSCVDILIGDDSEREVYGMRVYPTEDSLRQIATAIVTGNTTTRDMTKLVLNSKINYIVEIDPKVLYSKLYTFKPSEITAILLHELGHVTTNTDFYNDLLNAYRHATFNMERDKAKLCNARYNKKDIELGMLYIISSIQATQLNKTPDAAGNIEKEKIADKFVVDNGYGESLISAIDKFSKIYLNKYKKLNKSECELALQLEAESILTLSKTFENRKKYVTDMIGLEIEQTKSVTIKSLLKKVQTALKNVIFTEGAIIYGDMLKEGFIDKLLRNPIKVSQADIDDLKIQSEMMEDWDDKSIIVYKIHKRISQLDAAREKVGDDKQYISLLNSYQDQLDKLLQQTMKFKAVQKRYGVFIKYPKGYEG